MHQIQPPPSSSPLPSTYSNMIQIQRCNAPATDVVSLKSSDELIWLLGKIGTGRASSGTLAGNIEFTTTSERSIYEEYYSEALYDFYYEMRAYLRDNAIIHHVPDYNGWLKVITRNVCIHPIHVFENEDDANHEFDDG